jgi:hypothetical protein
VRFRRLVVSVLLPPLLGLVAVGAGAAPAAAEPTYTGLVVVSPSHLAQVYGRAVTVRAWLFGVDEEGNHPAPARVLTLQRKPPGGSFTDVGSLITDDAGAVTFRVTARSNARYRVTFAGDDVVTAATSQERTVRVLRKLGDRARKIQGLRFRFSGRVVPAYARQRVYLQRKGCPSCAWRADRSTRTTAQSRWGFVVRGAPKSGARVSYRAYVPASADYARSWSRTLRITTTG